MRVEKRRTSPGDILGDDSQFLSDWTVHQLTQRLPVERSDVAMYLQCCGGVKQKKHGTPGVRTCLRIQPAAHWRLGSFGTVSYQGNSPSKYGALHRVFPLDPEWGCCRNWLHWCSAMKTGIHKSTPHPLAVGMSRPLPLVLTCSTTVSATDQSSVAFSNCCCSTAVCTACAALLTSARPTSSNKDCKAKGLHQRRYHSRKKKKRKKVWRLSLTVE